MSITGIPLSRKRNKFKFITSIILYYFREILLLSNLHGIIPGHLYLKNILLNKTQTYYPKPIASTLSTF